MTERARVAFDLWWTSGQPESSAGQLALRSPAGKNAWENFRAGWREAAKSVGETSYQLICKGPRQTKGVVMLRFTDWEAARKRLLAERAESPGQTWYVDRVTTERMDW
jgi:hypothetical protein